MPKRHNPFGDHSPLQLKTHVGTKEVDKGVCQQTRMQSVFEKTQQMLFNGMKENQKLPLDGNDNVMIDFNQSNYGSSEHSSFRQMHLGKNCELVTDNDMDTGEVTITAPPPKYGNGANPQERVNACSEVSAPHFDITHRNHAEQSPPSVMCCEDVGCQGHHATNIFQRMLMAQREPTVKSVESKNYGGACHNCRRPVATREVLKCQFCENYMCGTCARQCKSCHMHFCQLCSVLNYEKSSEQAFCLTCLRR